MSEKTIRRVTIILGSIGALLIAAIAFSLLKDRVVGANNIAPTGVTITQITQNTAKVKWSTDRETQSIIEYGTTPTSLTFFAPEAVKTKNHEVELTLLTPETTYYFQIATGDKRFSNGGVPWTFTTQSKNGTTKTATPSASLSPTTAHLSPAPTSAVQVTTPTLPPAATSAPTATPTPQETPVPKDTACVLSEYTAQSGSKNGKYDIDNNGIVNSRDYALCIAAKPTSTPATTPTTTPTPTPTPST